MTRWAKRAIAMIVVVDFLVALVLIQQAIISRETISHPKKPPAVQTFGQYVVTSEWTGSDDVDLYVRDPEGNIVYFSNLSAGHMSLEHDDLGDATSGFSDKHQQERVVIRATEPGEYTVNVQMYGKYGAKPTTVTVTLWVLRGRDRQYTKSVIVLHAEGDERTAFRFVLNRNGDITSINHDQTRLTQVASPGGGAAPPTVMPGSHG